MCVGGWKCSARIKFDAPQGRGGAQRRSDQRLSRTCRRGTEHRRSTCLPRLNMCQFPPVCSSWGSSCRSNYQPTRSQVTEKPKARSWGHRGSLFPTSPDTRPPHTHTHRLFLGLFSRTHTHTGSFKDFHTRHRQVYAPALSRPNKKAPGREENGNSSAKKTL